MRQLNTFLKHVGANFGVDVQRIDHTLGKARERTFRSRGTSLVLDVGANRGQYVSLLRKNGYQGKIVSFEPIPEAYEKLVAAHGEDPAWSGFQCALSSKAGRASFNVSENLAASSLLPISDHSVRAAAVTQRVREIQVELRTLDEAVGAQLEQHSVHLKLDTQGSEMAVLEGATQSMGRISSVECELSLIPVYEGQPLIFEVVAWLYSAGFHATWLERGFQNQEGELLQVDALFVR